MGLGLVVGIAALGVIAARSVVERRQQIGVLRALGFHRLNETVEHEDSPSVRGMIAKVSHLVSAEVIGDGTR